MYTTTVGKTFLREYNRRNDQEHTAREFFDEVFFKIFFDHPKYLMWAQNSPFVQGVSSFKNGVLGVRDKVRDVNDKTHYFNDDNEELNKKVKELSEDESILEYKVKQRKGKREKKIDLLRVLSKNIREEKLQELHEKIKAGENDASIAIGYPASEVKEFATTSGLVTDLEFSFNEEEIYLSWIGAALSIGVSGGYALLFDNPEITYATFEGWQKYRNFLNNETLSILRPNQVVTWNGQWLTYRFGKNYSEDFDFRALRSEGIFSLNKNTLGASTKIEVNTVDWSRLFFSLSRQFPESILTVYVFGLGQTNKTLGFFPFKLKSGKYLVDIYKKLFGEETYMRKASEFESLFGKHIKRACELGSIGLQALEPKKLSKYFADSSNIKLKKPKISHKKNESVRDFEERKAKIEAKDELKLISFQTYKTWLIAMISKNKEEISDYTQKVANNLVKYREGARKTDRKNLLEKRLFAAGRKNEFLKALIEIVNDNEVDIKIVKSLKELRDRIHFMSNEDFVYFSLLLKFDYAYQLRIS
jgi:hypothetical protein